MREPTAGPDRSGGQWQHQRLTRQTEVLLPNPSFERTYDLNVCVNRQLALIDLVASGSINA